MSKRLFDLAVGVLLMVVLFPVLAIVALLVKVKLGSPVIFTQLRPGLNGSLFRMYKFRTMRDLRDSEGRPLPDAERLTRFGNLLRELSLDELPELWNVVRGDMSIVGPRPLLPEYLALYTPEQARRHDAKPGITGWAQVNGRNSLTWETRFALDVWYVDNRSLRLDLKILWLTVIKVAKREGISHRDLPTMSRFEGSTKDG
jgi:sugar transferase EpsL